MANVQEYTEVTSSSYLPAERILPVVVDCPTERVGPERIAHNSHTEIVMRKLVSEVVAVGLAEGADLDDSVADEVVNLYQNHPGDSVHSLHADRLAGRPMEIDLRNAVIVRLGRRHGISTPFNEMAVALLKSVS